ncbi:MAG: RnfH family protein [Pseudomonadota bacterium]|jgi:putative ubiquitin-RnfH superfamily antitoxin RatB of RatAB toxin-antitoxin module
MAGASEPIRVEIAYARPDLQVIVPLSVAEGTSAAAAIEASGLLQKFPEIDLAVNKIGIFGKACGADQPLRQGDRVEIYRPLIADPKESRRQRAAKKGEEKS